MIDYKCPQCEGAMSSPDSMAGQAEACPNCEYRCNVPGPALKKIRKPPAPSPPARQPKNNPPRYRTTTITAGFFRCTGLIEVGFGVIILLIIAFSGDDSMAPFGFLPMLIFVGSGFLNLAIGVGLTCLRDISRNTWLVVHRDRER